MTVCKWCVQEIFFFDKAPPLLGNDATERSGWASDHCGDTDHDFICPARLASGRWPDGKPHVPAEPRAPSKRTVLENQSRLFLRYGGEDGQYLACLVLRYLGHQCFGHDHGLRFYWSLDDERIDPEHKPSDRIGQARWTTAVQPRLSPTDP